MKESFEIIKEEYNPTTGETIVTVNTNYGAFTGIVKLDDIDAQYPSLYQGHELALSKALRKYAKQMIVIIREKIQPLKAVLAQCNWVNENTNDFVYGKATYLIKKEIQKLEKELTIWQKRVDAMSSTILTRINTRDRLVKTYLDKNR